MAEIIVMAKLGYNMATVKLLQWYKKEGDPLKKGEPFFSIETDKTAIDIEANHDGIFLKKFIEEGDTVEVTLPIAIVGKEGEDIGALVKEIKGRLNIADDAEEAGASEAAGTAVAAQAQTAAQDTKEASAGRSYPLPPSRQQRPDQDQSRQKESRKKTG
jgi:pyruvate dehydrogenase E2 component (dihydrolipoamide acetyltransferase)